MPVVPAAGDTVHRKFTTRAFSTGIPTTLAGTPAVSIYKDGSLAQSTAGVTLTADFDNVTGLNHVAIDTSADGTFYSNGAHFELVITTGTVGGVSVVGEVVGSFDLDAAVTVPTVAQVATAVWQDATSGDFTVSGSIGKSLYTGGVVPGASGGLFIAGTNAATTVTTSFTTTFTGSLTGSVNSVETAVTLPSIPNDWITAAGIAPSADTEIAAAVWDLATSGHTTAGTFGAAISASTPPSAATIAAAVWDEVNTGASHNVTNSTGKQLRTISGNTDAIYSGTCPSQAGMTATQIKLDAGASSTNNVYRYDVISIISGTNAGDSRIITGYTGSSKVATVDADWTTQPDATSVFEITPTARAQVVSYVAGQDPATLVWGAAVRTLTTLPTIPTNWLTADGLASDAVAEIQAGLSTYAGGDTSGVTTLLSRLTAGRATNLDRLDATISSRSTYAGEDTAGTSTLLARLTATRASRLDNLDVAISTLPDAAAIADKTLGRNIAGGSDGGRTVAQAMAFLRNKWVITAGTLTVYEANDSSVSWTSTVTTTSSNPVTGSDPA